MNHYFVLRAHASGSEQVYGALVRVISANLLIYERRILQAKRQRRLEPKFMSSVYNCGDEFLLYECNPWLEEVLGDEESVILPISDGEWRQLKEHLYGCQLDITALEIHIRPFGLHWETGFEEMRVCHDAFTSSVGFKKVMEALYGKETAVRGADAPLG